MNQTKFEIMPKLENSILNTTDKIISGITTISIDEDTSTNAVGFCDVRRKKIYIHNSNIKNTCNDYQDYWATLKGVNYHELAHLIYTFNNMSITPEFNVLEDARIENLFGLKYPKAFDYFKKSVLNICLKEGANEETFVLLYGRRFFINRKIIDTYEKKFLDKYGAEDTGEVKEIINDFLKSTDSDEQRALSERLAKILNKTPPPTSDEFSSKNGSGEPKASHKKESKKMEEAMDKAEKEMEDRDDADDADDGGSVGKEGQKKLTDKELKDEISKSLSETEQKIEDDIEDEMDMIKQKISSGDDGSFKDDIGKDEFNKTPMHMLAAKRLATKLKILRNEASAQYNRRQKSGRLDTRRFYTRKDVNELDIFKKYKHNKENRTKLLLTVFVDESSSMGWYNYYKAIEAAWVLCNAVEKVGGKSMVYAFATGYAIKKTFEGKAGWARQLNGVTEPSEAIMDAVKKAKSYARNRNYENILFIVITDGQYSLYELDDMGRIIDEVHDEGFTKKHLKKNNISSAEITVGRGFSKEKGYDFKECITSFDQLEMVMEKIIKAEQKKAIRKVL